MATAGCDALPVTAAQGGASMHWEPEPTQEDPRADEERIPEDSPLARLRMAQRLLFRTMLRLKVTQREQRALGDRWDPGALRRARDAYREAEVELRCAWTAWRAEMRAKEAAALAAGSSIPTGAQVTPAETGQARPSPDTTRRLHFARWLVERGTLSDWPGNDPATIIDEVP